LDFDFGTITKVIVTTQSNAPEEDSPLLSQSSESYMEGSLVVNEEMKNEERLPVLAMDSDD